MTADIKMLSLPEADDSVENRAQWPIVIDSDVWLQDSVQSYARAVAEHNVASRDAEIEALRAEVAMLREDARRNSGCMWRVQKGYTSHCQPPKNMREALARAERLAEALRDARDYVTTALREEREKFSGHEDCSDIPGIEADLHKIDAALRDHDQEATND